MNAIDLQRALWRLGFDPHGCDGIYGPHTMMAVGAFIEKLGVDPGTLTTEARDAAIHDALAHLPPLILAKHFTPSSRPTAHPIALIVIHTAEAPEVHKEAINVADFFAGIGCDAPLASAHWVVDDEQTVQCVLECDIAWAAPGANDNGIHIEHAGYASQTPEQWEDDYSRAVLARSASLTAALAARFDIPMVKLSVEELKAGGRGFVGHVDVTNAFCGGRGHVDPGPHFDWPAYMALVEASS